jgi:hypothetical protein
MTERAANKRRSAASPNRRGMKPNAFFRLGLWLSTSRTIDGLWVGSIAKEQQREFSLRRVEDALQLIKQLDTLCYGRITRDLRRIWVDLVPSADAGYLHSLQACVLDERFVLSEKTSIEDIALTMIHEATHGRIERCGIGYEEKLRSRIEAVCFRRQIAFARKLPNGTHLEDKFAQRLEYYTVNPDYFSNLNIDKREIEGRAEGFRYLGAPDWIIRVILRTRPVFVSFRSILRRCF